MIQARCPYCGRWFEPAPGKGARQKTCGSKACRRKHKRAMDRRWRAEDPAWERDRRRKVREWSRKRGYSKAYRARNPEYAERNRQQTRERMRRRRAERRKAQAVLADPVGYLRGLQIRCGEAVCKTGLGGAVFSTEGKATADDVCKTGLGEVAVVEVVDYLLARELFAKQEGRDAGRAAAG